MEIEKKCNNFNPITGINNKCNNHTSKKCASSSLKTSTSLLKSHQPFTKFKSMRNKCCLGASKKKKNRMGWNAWRRRRSISLRSCLGVWGLVILWRSLRVSAKLPRGRGILKRLVTRRSSLPTRKKRWAKSALRK